MSERSSKINNNVANNSEINSTDRPSKAKTVKNSVTRPQTQNNQTSGFTCPKCGEHKVAKSRSQSFDSWIMRFLPRRPYRCMRCYHRFWHKESFFADSRRAKSWILLVAVVLIVIALKTNWFTGDSETSYYQSDNSLVGTDPPDKAKQTSGGSNLLGSQDNDPNMAKVAQSESDTLSIDDKRDLIENLSFGEPSKASLSDAEAKLTASELKRRLADAKNKIEIAERQSKLKTEVLAAEVAESPEEVKSLARIDINYVIEQWRLAWEKGDSERYLGYYSESFIPNNSRKLTVWKQQRRSRVTPDRQIKLDLAKFEVEFAEDNLSALVSFDQRYQSKSYVDQSRKQLQVKKEGDQWYIVAERQINAG